MMSRSGYTDSDDDNLAYGRYRGAVASAIRGKRGQAFLRELVAALDALVDKRLCAGFLSADGDVCALGAVARSRGINTDAMVFAESDDADDCVEDVYCDTDVIGDRFGISSALAAEIMYWNDEVCGRDSPDTRWLRIRAWAQKRILP